MNIFKAGVTGVGSVGAGTTAAGTGQEYYGMQYPSCYSPATQGYAQYANMMGGSTSTPSQEYTPPSSTSQSRRSPGLLPPASSQTSLGGPPVPPVGSCKYADSNVGSPQDLSTTSSGGTPQPGAGPGGNPPKSPESDFEDPNSPLSPTPSGGAASSTKKEDVKSNPPQIYPWMKRVHLGQSKSFCYHLSHHQTL